MCGAEFQTYPCEVKLGRGTTCSRKCGNALRSTRRKPNSDYRRVWFERLKKDPVRYGKYKARKLAHSMARYYAGKTKRSTWRRSKSDANAQAKSRRESLHASYINVLLSAQAGVPYTKFPPEIVELKTEQLRLLRAARTHNDNAQD
jgi:hypothetical protein